LEAQWTAQKSYIDLLATFWPNVAIALQSSATVIWSVIYRMSSVYNASV